MPGRAIADLLRALGRCWAAVVSAYFCLDLLYPEAPAAEDEKARRPDR